MTNPSSGGSYRLDPVTGEHALVEPPTAPAPRRGLPPEPAPDPAPEPAPELAPEKPARAARTTAAAEEPTP